MPFGGKGKKNKREKKNAASASTDKPARAPRTAKVLVKDNEKFNFYYKKQNLMPAGEFEAFLEQLRQPLPITFRLVGIQNRHHEMLQRLTAWPSTDEYQHNDLVIKPPSPLHWHPHNVAWQLNVPKKELRKVAGLRDFFLKITAEQELGNVVRQEAVSMIPTLLLDVQSHHLVLDMCAAPGSKSSQLIETLHRGCGAAPTSDFPTVANSPPSLPTGLVVANDSNPARAHMLTHQLKKLGSPCFIVTTHEGQFFPTLWKGEADAQLADTPRGETPAVVMQRPEEQEGKPGGPRVEDRVWFDRILCDVPCSGDGTMRKSPLQWKNWDASIAIGLHPLQLAIATRGLQMLAVGGLMVYSTCTFNPLENEAVVAELLRRSQGGVEIVDVSEQLPGLIRRPGLDRWAVLDKGTDEYTTMEEVPGRRRHRIKASMFSPSPEETSAFCLQRCVRMLPQDQDTGGFFVCVLRKTRAVEYQASYATEGKTAEVRLKKRGGKAVREKKEADLAAAEATAATAAGDAVDAVDADAGDADDAGGAGNAEEAKEAGPAAKKQKTAGGAKATQAGDDDDDNGGDLGAVEDPKRLRTKTTRGQRSAAYYGEPYGAVQKELYDALKGFYGLSDAVPRSSLFTRSTEERKVYFVGAGAASILRGGHNGKLKIVFSGQRIFDFRGGTIKDCRMVADDKTTAGTPYVPITEDVSMYRISQEGVHNLAHHLAKQSLTVSYSVLTGLLDAGDLDPETITEEEEQATGLRARLDTFANGCVVACLQPTPAELASHPFLNEIKAVTLACLHKSPNRLTIMMNKQERLSYLSLLRVKAKYSTDIKSVRCPSEEAQKRKAKEAKEAKEAAGATPTIPTVAE